MSFVSSRPSLALPQRTLGVSGKQNTQFPMGPVIKSFAIPPKFKNGTNSEKIICLFDPGWQINFLHFKVQDLITCKSKVPVVVCLGSWWVLTHDMWHILLQSENVLGLGGTTRHFKFPCSFFRALPLLLVFVVQLCPWSPFLVSCDHCTAQWLLLKERVSSLFL